MLRAMAHTGEPVIRLHSDHPTKPNLRWITGTVVGADGVGVVTKSGTVYLLEEPDPVFAKDFPEAHQYLLQGDHTLWIQKPPQ